MTIRAPAAAAFWAICLSGCAMPAGMNSDCRWPAEGARQLIADVRIAEELAIRYADARHSRRPSRDQWRPAHDTCLDAMFRTIAERRGVRPADVRSARARLGDVGFRPAVHVPLAFLYAAVAWLFVRRIGERFRDDGGVMHALAILFVSLAATALVVVFGFIWEAAVEMVRVGNPHMSYRGQRSIWPHHAPASFIAGVLLFWIVALVPWHQLLVWRRS